MQHMAEHTCYTSTAPWCPAHSSPSSSPSSSSLSSTSASSLFSPFSPSPSSSSAAAAAAAAGACNIPEHARLCQQRRRACGLHTCAHLWWTRGGCGSWRPGSGWCHCPAARAGGRRRPRWRSCAWPGPCWRTCACKDERGGVRTRRDLEGCRAGGPAHARMRGEACAQGESWKAAVQEGLRMQG